jgi:hypothetical protein
MQECTGRPNEKSKLENNIHKKLMELLTTYASGPLTRQAVKELEFAWVSLPPPGAENRFSPDSARRSIAFHHTALAPQARYPSN